MNPIDTRPAALAGTWYSANPQQLNLDVETYLQHAAPPEVPGEIVALFAPHAGHHYSGPVAGYAFRTIQGNSYETIAVVSPYHRGYPQRLLTTSHERYSTPLGEVLVDTDSLFKLKEQLQETAGEELALVRQDREHAIEIELPFLQVAVAGKFELLPVMVSDNLAETGIALGKALAAVLKGKKALLIASTDLSHFYPEAMANQLDLAMLEAIASFDTEEVIEVHRSGKGQACGFLPVLAVMTAAQALGAKQAHILHYATSGSTSGDYSRVVGYGAGVFTR